MPPSLLPSAASLNVPQTLAQAIALHKQGRLAEAERLYLRSGWQRVGVVPDYAMWPAGGFCDTTFFWKKL